MSKESGFLVKGEWVKFLSKIDREVRDRIVSESFEMWLMMRPCEISDRMESAACEGIVSAAKEISDKYEERAARNRANGALGGRPPKPTDKPTGNPMVKTEKPNGLQAEKTPPDALETQRFNVGLGKERKGMERNGTERNGKELNTPPTPKGEKREVFKKPTVDEVESYCKERGNGVSPQAFCDYYDSVGWKVGKKTMKDWRACVRTWEQRDGRGPKKVMVVDEEQAATAKEIKRRMGLEKS